MKTLIFAAAALLAALFVSGGAFAIPGGAVTTLEAPVATIKASACHRHVRPRRHSCHRQCCDYYRCCGYYSLYTYTMPCCASGGCAYTGCGGFFGGRFGW